jgi:hypothetical protein
MTAEEKPERPGLKGRLAHIESTLRLLGGANATGAIAAGVAFHTFENNADIQNAVKIAAVLFLFGVLTFTLAQAFLFITILEVDHAMHKKGEPNPEYLFWISPKSPEEHKKSAYRTFVVVAFGMLASFVLFIAGLACVLLLAVSLLKVGS